jgi:hypothetical protein
MVDQPDQQTTDTSGTTSTTEQQALTIEGLQEIFGFSGADLLANRDGRYSFGQHRLISTAILMLVFAVLVLFTWPIQREAGRVLGFIGGICFGLLDLVALIAGVSGVAALWNTARESRQTPIQTYRGWVGLQQNKDESWALVSDAFTIPIETEAAERFIEGEYQVYYVPKFVNDRDNLFSIEPV